MKNKKRVLTILLILIAITTIILAIVLVFGGMREKEIEENYTKEICEGFDYLCKIHNDKLIARDYIKSNLKNPLTGKKASEDTKNYVEVTWKEDKIKCTYKEG